MRWFASLRRARDFARLRRRGRHAGLATLTAYGSGPGHVPPRVGITVGKAVGAAVVRNRVRRRLQGALDAQGNAGLAPSAGDLLLVAKPAAAAARYETLAADVAEALARVGGAR
jgi:ribonuclease P protein component